MTTTTLRLRSVSGEPLAKKLTSFERHVRKARKHWHGTDAEFDSWADRSAAQMLRSLAHHCFVSHQG